MQLQARDARLAAAVTSPLVVTSQPFPITQAATEAPPPRLRSPSPEDDTAQARLEGRPANAIRVSEPRTHPPVVPQLLNTTITVLNAGPPSASAMQREARPPFDYIIIAPVGASRDNVHVRHLSVTVERRGNHIQAGDEERVVLFLESQHVSAGVVAGEVGPNRGWYHLQCLMEACTSSSKYFASYLKHWIWGGDPPPGAAICAKELSGEGVHRWSPMIGYCLKDHVPGNTDFRAYHKGLTSADLEQGRHDYALLGKDPIEKRIRLDKKNLFGKVYLFSRMSSAPISRRESFEPMLLAALRSGRYYADASWTIAPYGNGRLCRYRAAAAYKLYTDPHNFSKADMQILFFQPKTREENHEWAEAVRKEHRRFLDRHGGASSPDVTYLSPDLPPHNPREPISLQNVDFL
jgi:hypothetical protein